MSHRNQAGWHDQYTAIVPARPVPTSRADSDSIANLQGRLFEMIVRNEAQRRCRSTAQALQARFAAS